MADIVGCLGVKVPENYHEESTEQPQHLRRAPHSLILNSNTRQHETDDGAQGAEACTSRARSPARSSSRDGCLVIAQGTGSSDLGWRVLIGISRKRRGDMFCFSGHRESICGGAIIGDRRWRRTCSFYVRHSPFVHLNRKRDLDTERRTGSRSLGAWSLEARAARQRGVVRALSNAQDALVVVWFGPHGQKKSMAR